MSFRDNHQNSNISASFGGFQDGIGDSFAGQPQQKKRSNLAGIEDFTAVPKKSYEIANPHGTGFNGSHNLSSPFEDHSGLNYNDSRLHDSSYQRVGSLGAPPKRVEYRETYDPNRINPHQSYQSNNSHMDSPWGDTQDANIPNDFTNDFANVDHADLAMLNGDSGYQDFNPNQFNYDPQMNMNSGQSDGNSPFGNDSPFGSDYMMPPQPMNNFQIPQHDNTRDSVSQRQPRAEPAGNQNALVGGLLNKIKDLLLKKGGDAKLAPPPAVAYQYQATTPVQTGTLGVQPSPVDKIKATVLDLLLDDKGAPIEDQQVLMAAGGIVAILLLAILINILF